MNDSERSVNDYLTSLQLGPVVFEPDGNQPPDFLVDGHIAVEARRLNVNEVVCGEHRGLEQTSMPLHSAVTRALAASGPADSGFSWYVHYSVRRPLPSWRTVERQLQQAVLDFKVNGGNPVREIWLGSHISLEFERAGRAHDTLLVLGGSSDDDEGRFVVAEVVRNLRYCIAEKREKIERVRHSYGEWWLAFEDRIGYGALDTQDALAVSAELGAIEGFAKVVLVNPLDPTRGVEVWNARAA